MDVCLMCWALHRSLTMIYYDEMLNVINIDARISSSPWHFTKFAYMFSQIKQRHFWKPQICAHINYKMWYLIPTWDEILLSVCFRFHFHMLDFKSQICCDSRWIFSMELCNFHSKQKKLIWNFKMFACICMYKIPF